MPRIPREQQGEFAYHVINRGNGRATVFHKPQDYEAFLSLLAEAKKRHQVKLFGFCLMSNHFHLVLEPAHQTALSQFMQWLVTSHVRRYHKHYGSSGHIWQGESGVLQVVQSRNSRAKKLFGLCVLDYMVTSNHIWFRIRLRSSEVFIQ